MAQIGLHTKYMVALQCIYRRDVNVDSEETISKVCLEKQRSVHKNQLVQQTNPVRQKLDRKANVNNGQVTSALQKDKNTRTLEMSERQLHLYVESMVTRYR